jgi:hypothetical protein
MPLRNLLLAGLTAAFAAGGFYLGHSREAQASELKVSTPDFSRVPPSRISKVLQTQAKRLHLTPAQVARIRELAGTELAKRRLEMEAAWRRDLVEAEKFETGDRLPTGEGLDAYYAMPLGDEPDFVFQNLWNADLWNPVFLVSNQEPGYKRIVTPKVFRQAIYLASDIDAQVRGRAYDVAVDDATLARLELSPRQRRQFATLRTRVDALLRNSPATSKKVSLKAGARSFVVSRQQIKPIGLRVAFRILEPKQKMALKSMLWNQFTVEP